MRLPDEVKDMFVAAKAAAGESKETVGKMKTAMKLTRKFIKVCRKIQNEANLDEKRTKPDELPALYAKLDNRLKEADDILTEILALGIPAFGGMAARLNESTIQMRAELEKNWPVFVEQVKAAQ